MKNFITFGVLVCSIVFFGCKRSENKENTLETQNERLEQKVDSVLALMTLQEKIGQLVQYNGSWDLTGPPSDVGSKDKLEKIKNGGVGSMLNVLTVAATREAQKAVMEHSRMKIPLIFGYDVIHGYKTIFPIPLGETASWDLQIMKKTAEIAAREASASGIHWTFSPMLDVSRDARWGRIMEGSGEDPYLISQIAVAKITGYQGTDLSDPRTIAACAKHFAGYGFAEAGREYNTANIGMHELQNVVLPPFRAAAEAGAATFMNSFNDIDGVPATGSVYLQRELLKGNWKWDGFVVSDWASIAELVTHGYAVDLKHAAELAMNAGSDMDMEGNAYEKNLETLVSEGKVDPSLIDDSVRRILRIKFRLGLFDDPYRYCDENREKTEIYTSENLAVARDAGRKSIVLLKNEKNILPLKKSSGGIAIIGPLADDKDTPIGNWRAQGVGNSAVSFLEGIEKALGSKVQFEKGVELSTGERSFMLPMTFNTTDRSGIPAAVALAKRSEVVLLVVGEDAFQSGEGRSQTNIGFAGLQHELIEAVYNVNKNIVLVVMNGRPLDLSWYAERIPAILITWHLGSEAGNAIADVVFGDYNPSGKLPVSFPHTVGQEPLYYSQKNTGRPSNPTEVTYSHYNDSPKTALYPFGFGLSYTHFEYSNLKLSSAVLSPELLITITIDVKNTGNYDGEEVVQFYIRDLVGSIIRPVLELKGFEKVFIKKGETKTVTFTVDTKTLEFFTGNNKWETEPGDFRVFVGGSSISTLSANFKYVLKQ